MLIKYLKKKKLTDMEKLQYKNIKLRIENERLKREMYIDFNQNDYVTVEDYIDEIIMIIII